MVIPSLTGRSTLERSKELQPIKQEVESYLKSLTNVIEVTNEERTIAATMGLSRTTVRRWIRNFKERGTVFPPQRTRKAAKAAKAVKVLKCGLCGWESSLGGQSLTAHVIAQHPELHIVHKRFPNGKIQTACSICGAMVTCFTLKSIVQLHLHNERKQGEVKMVNFTKELGLVDGKLTEVDIRRIVREELAGLLASVTREEQLKRDLSSLKKEYNEYKCRVADTMSALR